MTCRPSSGRRSVIPSQTETPWQTDRCGPGDHPPGLGGAHPDLRTAGAATVDGAAVCDERDAPPPPPAVAAHQSMTRPRSGDTPEPPGGEARPLAAFDLDGTLTHRETLLPFLQRA